MTPERPPEVPPEPDTVVGERSIASVNAAR